MILVTNIVYVVKARWSLLLCAVELHWCPQNTLLSRTVALGDVFLHYLHYYENGH